jgi:diguanylate cyclase (GGDEF)-like protein
MDPLNPSSELVSLTVQVLGTLLFSFVYLFLWRRSGIVYFGLWSIAWVFEALALWFYFRYSTIRYEPWFYAYALCEFVFAVLLMAAAQAGLATRRGNWRVPLRLLLIFPAFLLLVYVIGMRGGSDAYRALHGLVLSSIYFYNFASIGANPGTGVRLFRFSLLCLAAAFLHHAAAFLYLYFTGRTPIWALALPHDRLFDFALQTLLAFSATALWIETQNDRIIDLGGELDRLRRESLTNVELDRLTGLLNQSALAKRMEDVAGFSGVVTVCDMDNFKEINDIYGHLVGDEILRNVGHLLRSSIRQQDEAFRWGGDEFVIVFRNQNRDVARSRMREIENRLRDFRVRGSGSLSISFSWGTAEAAGRPLRETLDEADREMYATKRDRKKTI